MNPVAITEDIRRLDLMLHGGIPLRADPDFGKEDMGHLDSVKSRSPDVRIPPTTQPVEPEFIIERYVITEDGVMVVEVAGAA
jgi:hypothetical protein